MKLDPDEKKLRESLERGEWKPASADEGARSQSVCAQPWIIPLSPQIVQRRSM